MPKDQFVADAIAKIQAGEVAVMQDAIGAACDAAALEQKASDGTLTQADMDAAVAAAQATDAAALTAALDAAHADAQTQLDALQVKVDTATAKMAQDDVVVKGLNDAMDKIQGSLDALKALFPVVATA